MGTVLLKRLPIAIGLLLMATLCGVGLLTQLDFSSGISDSSTPPESGPEVEIIPINPTQL